MQVHERPQAAPVLVLRGIKIRGFACKTMHLMDAWLFSGKIAEFSGIFLRATVRPVLHVGGCKSGSVPG